MTEDQKHRAHIAKELAHCVDYVIKDCEKLGFGSAVFFLKYAKQALAAHGIVKDDHQPQDHHSQAS